MDARLLALDSSTERLVLGLHWQGCARTLDEEGGALASARIVPQAMALLAEAGATLAGLDAIAFARGPGAFTGLRTACAVAQGLAFGVTKPVLALDSLLVVAEDARRGEPRLQEVWVAMDARMGEVYAGRYRHHKGDWHTLCEPALYELQALAAAWAAEPPAAVAGGALGVFGDALPVGAARCFPETRSRAEALLALAQAAWRRGPRLDPADAMPLYLRDKVALTTAERAAAPAVARRQVQP